MAPAAADSTTRLGALLVAAARGVFPASDGTVDVLNRPAGPVSAVLGFTAHHVVAADVDPGWVESQLPPGSLSAPLGPPFLHALEQRIGARAGSIDVVLTAESLAREHLADGAAGRPPLRLAEAGGSAHDRVRRAELYRSSLRSWTTPGGVLVIGRGLAGRWEAAFEVEPEARGRGLGRALAQAARHLVPQGEPLFMQVAPANAASLRAIVAAGFTPIGAEVLLLHR